MAEPMNAPSLLLVLHDVAPQTWADYQPFVEAVDALGRRADDLAGGARLPQTQRPATPIPDFVACSTHALARGDELALHGYFHCDDGPRPSNPRDWFMRRIYTHEGEFYSLSREAALARLHAGIEMFQRYDWPLQGFVAPAWLMSEGTRQALRQLPLSYTSDPQHLYRLPDFTADRCPRTGLECAQCLAPGLIEDGQRSTRTTLATSAGDSPGLAPGGHAP